jgi:monoterpene epsilon-lactone hydrolase
MADDIAAIGALGELAMPARTIGLPTTVSRQARQFLATPRLPPTRFPALDDVAGWRRLIGIVDEGFAQRMGAVLEAALAKAERTSVAGADVYVAAPPNPLAGKVCLSLHGGALVVYGGRLVGWDAVRSAEQTNCLTWSVDYGMPPDAPYPAGLDQAVAVYGELLKTYAAGDIVVTGLSAGGNIAAAMLLKARDQGLAMPAAVMLRTPELDLTESGDSFATHMGVDNVLGQSLMTYNKLYAGGADLADPYLSPLFGDFTKGYPRAFLQAGTRDLFLSNTVRMHRALLAAGVEAELHVWEAMPHAGFGGAAPEDAEVNAAIGDYVRRVFAVT